MCVICSAARKRHIKREEVLEAMSRNSDGFFVCALKPDGKRDYIRTMEKKSAIEFFDEKVKEEDGVVLHARIVSRGAKKLENVHGWEEDGIVFCHNMTFTGLSQLMTADQWGDKTDSEFFFRKIFMPHYRGYGKDAYKDGKLHPELENYVKYFIGTSNKVLFIMPDNNVLHYGDGVEEKDRVENGKCAFWASNTSYKVYHYPKQTVVTGYGGRGCDADDYAEWEESRWGMYGGQDRGRGASGSADKTVFTGELSSKILSVSEILQILVDEWVVANTARLRSLDGPRKDIEELLEKQLGNILPSAYTSAGCDIIEMFLNEIVDGYTHESQVQLAKYVKHLDEDIITEGGKYKNASATPECFKYSLEKMKRESWVAKRLLNIDIRPNETDPKRLASAFYMEVSRQGNPVMRKADIGDLLTPDDMTVEQALEAFANVLKWMHDNKLPEVKK